ncbi:MAG: amidohydrolase family protein [Acidobacteria bacterium]|nr:amidohydrolase family protein [Acidobacteriota bacterium]
MRFPLYASFAALVSLAGSQGPQPVDLIVYNAIVVTMDPAGRVLPRGAVAITGREITAVEPAEAIASRYTAKETLDAGGQIILPGLVNTHTHAPMVLYRGLADDLALMEWLEKYIFPAEAKTVSPEFVRAGTRLAALEMIQSGTTTYTDMYYFEEEVARVTKAAGLRGVLGQTVIQFPVADAKTPADALTRSEAFLKEFANDELIVPALAPHSMYTLDRATLKAVRAMGDKYSAPVLIHLSETAAESKTAMTRHKMSPTRYLESIGFWGPRSLAAHGVWLSAPDIQILARRKVGVSHNPESNMKLASGVAKVPALQRAGVTVGLGTDGAASNNDLDMFEAMRQAAFLHKLTTNDPRTLPAKTALAMATIDGARALGMDRQIGSLEAGKRADLILVSVAGARQTPMYDPLSHLVYVTRGDDVSTTIVNGKILMRDRQMLTLNEPDVIKEANAFAAKVREAVGK